MRFKDLKPSDIEVIKFFYYSNEYSHEEKMEELSKRFDVKERTIRRWWKEELGLSKKYAKLPKVLEDAQEKEIDSDTDIVFFTAAQNKTAVNRKMLKNMEAYRDFLTEKGFKTQIIIAPTRYRNPTSPQEDFSEDEWWVGEVLPYLCYNNLEFYDKLLQCKSKIRPTAVNPLSGLDLFASEQSAIFPHSRIHFKTMPRLRGQEIRTLSTTGYITVKNYSDSKAGEKAFENHSYGFVVIEKDTVARNVKVNSNGNFSDIIYQVIDGEVSTIDKSEAIIMGDIHGVQVNKEFLDVSLKHISKLNPYRVILHDLFDGYSINPHEEKDMFLKRIKIKENKHDLSLEIEKTLDILDKIKKVNKEIYVVESNHDNFIDRYINSFNWKNDLHNSVGYLGLAHIQQTVDLRDYGNLFGYLLYEFGTIYLKYGESLNIRGYECALHGDNGTNGSRGSTKQFSNLNIKMIHGHTHTPSIIDGVTSVGITCKKEQHYNRKGLSSWAYAHSIIHKTGKNQLLVYTDNYKLSNLL